jgi:hypothetical protein
VFVLRWLATACLVLMLHACDRDEADRSGETELQPYEESEDRLPPIELETEFV